MTDANYMVTAGDVYQLLFNANGNAINYTVIVDTSYKIRVANLAVLDVRGKTYSSLKKQVEEIVMKNYPFSGVQFVLTQPAVFYVTVKGEVTKTTEVRAWGLSRLSTVLSNVLTDYSSTRSIQVTSADVSEPEKDFGLKPYTSLREGLRKFAAWYYLYYCKK